MMSDFPSPDPQAVVAVKSHKLALLTQEEAQMGRMASEWLEIERKLQANVAELAREITEKMEAGEMVADEILRLDKYHSLAAQAAMESERYAVWAADLTTAQQEILINQSITDTVEAIQLSYEGYGLDYPAFDLLPIEAVENLVGAASNGSPLNLLFAEISDEAVMGMTGALIDGVSLGLPPAEVAKMMANGFGIGLDRALNIARTEQLNAYRRTSQAQYDRSGVVEGYRRIAQHTPTTCPGCLFMDGEFFPNSVSFEEHPRGRCGMIPVVEGAPYPEFETGKDWFMKQPPDVQLRILGPGRFDAFEQGLPLDEFVAHRWNDEWGGSWVPRNVGDLPKPPGVPPGTVPDLPPAPDLPGIPPIRTGAEAREEIFQLTEENFRKRVKIQETLEIVTDDLERSALRRQELIQEALEIDADDEIGWIINKANRQSHREYEARLTAEFEKLTAENLAIMDAERGQILDLLYVENPAIITSHVPDIFSFADFEIPEYVNEGLEEFSRFVSSDAIPEGLDIGIFAIEQPGRASYSEVNNLMMLNSNSGVSTVIHEAGHALNHATEQIIDDVAEFFEHRVTGYDLKPLSEIAAFDGYDALEMAYDDGFIDPYMGKFYGEFEYQDGRTEIVSMGIEFFYREPEYLIRKDPEMFDFIFDLVRGRSWQR